MFLFLFFFRIRIFLWCSILPLIDENQLFSIDGTYPLKIHIVQCSGKKGRGNIIKKWMNYLLTQMVMGSCQSNSDSFLQGLSCFSPNILLIFENGHWKRLSSVLPVLYSSNLQVTGVSIVVSWPLKPATFFSNCNY